MKTILLTLTVFTLYCTYAAAQPYATPSDTMPQSARKRHGMVNRLLDYFNDANKPKNDRRFDFSIIGGPHYDTDTKLGLGLVAAGLYHADSADSLSQPSNVSLFSDVSTVGFYMLGIRGTHFFPHDRRRMNYTVYFYSFPSKFWGMGYDEGNNDSNRSEMKRWQARFKADYLFRLAENMFLGPVVTVDYVATKDVENPLLLHGMDTHTWNFGAGLAFAYDTRDVITNPHRGVYVGLTQYFRPRFLGNDYAFSTTELTADAYCQPWHNAVLAADVRTLFNFGHPSWGMMAQVGNGHSMRGYYEGRYRDKHKMEAQVELRQKVWRRNGVVAWAGVGTVFDRFSALRSDHLLPNFGIGYRWEFKKDVNVRLDYGFGKAGQSGFLFNINEAF